MKKPKLKPPPPAPTEYVEQANIFGRAQIYCAKYPELKFLNGSLNGVRLPIGLAVKCKKIGMRRGYPDIFLPVKRGPYSGLFIELKRVRGGQISKEQRDWREFLISQGYQHRFCRGADEAWAVILEYLCLRRRGLYDRKSN